MIEKDYKEYEVQFTRNIYVNKTIVASSFDEAYDIGHKLDDEGKIAFTLDDMAFDTEVWVEEVRTYRPPIAEWITKLVYSSENGKKAALAAIPYNLNLRHLCCDIGIKPNSPFFLYVKGEWEDKYLDVPLPRLHTDDLNFLAHRIYQLSDFEHVKLLAVVEQRAHEIKSVMDIINCSYNLDMFRFVPGIEDDKALGEILLREQDSTGQDIDAEQKGFDLCKDECGYYTHYGYIGEIPGMEFIEHYTEVPDIFRIPVSPSRSKPGRER